MNEINFEDQTKGYWQPFLLNEKEWYIENNYAE